MVNLRTKLTIVSIVIGGLLLAACAPAERREGSEAHYRINWYVETTGDDLNICSEPAEPCRTLGEALSRADADDMIIIGEGTFNEVGTDSFSGPFAIDAASLWITGAGMGSTIIDFGGSGGMVVWGPGNYRLENFTLQNGDFCLTISDRRDRDLDLPTINTATMENIEASDCRTGIRIFGTGERLLNNVMASGNRTGLYVQGAYDVNVGASQFNGNSAFGIESSDSVLSICCSTEVDGNGGALTSRGVAFGGGINVGGGTVTISETTITNNGAPGGSIDPAVRADGGSSVSIADSLIDGNIEGVGSFSDSNLLVEDTIITDNANEGVFVWGGEAHLYNVDVRNNCIRPATDGGCWAGGVTSYRNGVVEIRDSYITDNSNGPDGLAGGVFSRDGELNISGSTITGNEGSCGINNQGQAVIANSLIANNQAVEGNPPVVGICNYDTLSIHNSTISGHGIGLQNGGELSMSYVTIAENAEVGLVVTGADLVRRVNNVLIVNNGLQDCVGSAELSSIVSGTNINTDDSCPDSFVSYSSSELALGELADNGGPTLTHALLPGSPAMDAATGTCLEVDQRFVARPVGPACDVGAYEAGASATSLELTATPETDTLIVKEDFPCYTGPGPQYNTLSTMKAGTQLNVVGYSFAGGWFVAAHPTLQGSNCWIDEDFVETLVPVGELRLIAVPPKPTPTPSPASEPRPEEVEPTVCVAPLIDPKACD